jgi:transposase-like protein
MNHEEFIGHLGNVSVAEVGEVLQEFLRGQTRLVFLKVLEAEVEQICGSAYQRGSGSNYRRAGSAPGFFYDGHRRVDVRRPRVRKKGAAEEEVLLGTYEAGRMPGELQRMMVEAIRAGVSSRGVGQMHDKAPGTSSSASSRLWVQESAKAYEEFRSRDLARPDWLVLMLDGIRLAEDLFAIAALGIRATGEKVLLDFELGTTEDCRVASALVRRIIARGFAPAAKALLVVLDGGKGITRAVKKHFACVVIQRCLVHKERNLRSYLSRKHHAELARLFKLLRRAQGPEAAEEALANIRTFVGSKNQQAVASLDEAGDQLTALQKLDVPATLHLSLLSTNCIENPFRNTRAKTRRVTFWQAETKQPARWLAYAFQEAEKGFRRIQGRQDLPQLFDALNRHAEARENAAQNEQATEGPQRPITRERRIDRSKRCA